MSPLSPSLTLWKAIRLYTYIKKNIIQQKGISLVVIPCWWCGSLGRYIYFILFISYKNYYFFFFIKSIIINLSHSWMFHNSLLSSIRFQRPDLFEPQGVPPISLNPSLGYFHCRYSPRLFYPPPLFTFTSYPSPHLALALIPFLY